MTVTIVPPVTVPKFGETEVTVTGGTTRVTLADFASLQPALVVTVRLIVSVPAVAPAVKVMLGVLLPLVRVPPVTVQA